MSSQVVTEVVDEYCFPSASHPSVSGFLLADAAFPSVAFGSRARSRQE